MKTRLAIAMLGALLIGTVGAVEAGHGYGHGKGRFDDRQDHQRYRIERGVDHGRLTRGESRVLRQEQRQINRTRRAFLHDGHIAKHERRYLDRAQDRANRRILRLNQNGRHYHGGRHYGHGHGKRYSSHRGYGHRHHDHRRYGHDHYAARDIGRWWLGFSFWH